MAVTNGGQPSATSLDFLSAFIPGLLSTAQRGTVSGTVSGSFAGQPVTVAIAGPTSTPWLSIAPDA